MKNLILISITLFCINSFLFCQQWTQIAGTPEGAGITDMVITSNETIIVTCASFNWPNGQFGGIRHSTNGGATWENDYQHFTARTLALGQNGYVYASSWDYPTTTEGLWVSYDQGGMWAGQIYVVGTNNNIFSILVRDNNQTVYIGTRTGVRKSTNGGSTFTPANNGIPANSWVRDIEADSAGVLAAATTNGLFISTNNASSWIPTTGIQDTVVTLRFDYPLASDGSGNGTRLLAGTDNGSILNAFDSAHYTLFTVIALFGDDEASDIMISYLTNANIKVHGVATFPRDNQSTGFSTSTNNGTTWQQNNNGLPPNPKISAGDAQVQGSMGSLTNITYYVGLFENTTNGAKVYKMDAVFGIVQISNEIPNSFSLSQNYPNPFNPATKMKFDVSSNLTLSGAKGLMVSLKIFDILGREIATLVNEQLKPGSYEIEWNASNYPGGVYFYKLTAGDFSESKKMLLVK